MLRRLPALLALAAVALAVLPPAASARSTGAIQLRVVYDVSDTATPQVLTLRCDPARGTVAHPAAACRKLRAIGPDAFAPTPRGMRLCAQLYGGPMTAIVSGSYYGRHIWARLSRVDGCAIARWTRVAFLFPSVPAARPGTAPGG